MTKLLKAVAICCFVMIAGCTTTRERSRVIVTVDPDGQLQSQGFTLTDFDLIAFRRETGNKPVLLIPANGPSYDKAVDAKRRLNAAGISNVAIGGESGG